MYLSTLSTKVRFDNFPSLREYFLTVMFLLYMEDIFFFLTHRLFHLPFFYKHIHKQHHEYDTTFSFVSEYANPVEYFIGNLVLCLLNVVFVSGGHYSAG